MSPLIYGNFIAAVAQAVATDGIANSSVLRWLNLASALMRAGGQMVSEMQALTAQVQQMVNEQRDPTAEEWAMQGAESDALSEAIAAAADEQRASE